MSPRLDGGTWQLKSIEDVPSSGASGSLSRPETQVAREVNADAAIANTTLYKISPAGAASEAAPIREKGAEAALFEGTATVATAEATADGVELNPTANNAKAEKELSLAAMGRFRSIVKSHYEATAHLREVLDELEDETFKANVEVVFGRIFHLLAFLDTMWNKHQVVKNPAGIQIVYPPRMQKLARAALRLIVGLKLDLEQYGSLYYSDAKKAAPATDDADFDLSFGEFYFGEEAESSQPPEVADLNEVAISTHTEALSVTDIQSKEDKRKEAIAKTMWELAQAIGISYADIRKVLKAVTTKPVAGSNDQDRNIQTLSYDIDDFVRDEIDHMLQMLFQLALTIDPTITRHQVIPGIAEQEQDAVELRSEFSDLVAQTQSSMAKITDADPQKENITIVATLTTLMKRIRLFQIHQENNLEARKYRGVLPGVAYEKFNALAKDVNDFLENDSEKLDDKTAQLFVVRKRLSEFAERIKRDLSLEEPSTEAATELRFQLRPNQVISSWLNDMKELQGAEERILANGLTPDQLLQLQDKYVDRFFQVINRLDEIARGKKANVVQGDKPAAEVPQATMEYFARFKAENEMMGTFICEDFNPSFFKLLKLGGIVENFTKCHGNLMATNSPTQLFLKEYDDAKEAAERLHTELFNFLSVDYTQTTPEHRNALLILLATCRQLLAQLRVTARDDLEQIHELDLALSDMEKTVRARYAQNKPIPEDELQAFYLQFIHGAIDNPIVR